METIGVFVAWPYANGELHLGHIAGAYLPADIFARYHRLRGNRVLMVSGSDAHGTPITLKAREEGCSPAEVVSRYTDTFLDGWLGLGITFDLFTTTHTQNHISLTQEFFRKLKANGDLSVKSEKQFYDTQVGIFLPDRYVRGTCPKCGYVRARGDQCEQCGSTFDSTELLQPISILSDTAPEVRDTEHFFFEMERYGERIRDFIDKNAHWRPAVQNLTRSMIADGVKARAITRDIDWGVPVPEAGWESKVIYVWFDAVIGYLSASKEWSTLQGSSELWRQWWEAPEARSYYFIGKDNIPFHTVIWPIELMAFDSRLNLPYDVPANQFLNIEGEKFSTSRGLAVWLREMLERVDPDALRFYLASIMPETKDANFSAAEFVARNNGELVAAWGNLVNRVLSFCHSRFNGAVPRPGKLTERDESLLRDIEQGFNTVDLAYREVRLRDALKEALRLTREVNKYLDETAPWTTIKQDVDRAGSSVYVALKAIDSLKILLAPIIPFSCEKLHSFLGYPDELFGNAEKISRQDEIGSYRALTYHPGQAEQLGHDRWKMSRLTGGEAIQKPAPLFKLMEE